MKYGTIAGVGDHISRLVLGGLVFSPERAEVTATLLEAFVAAGGTAVDTASAYGAGNSERALGAWLASTQRREQITLITTGPGREPGTLADGQRRPLSAAPR
jgi:aryl-alcohol dehydrogenase-like predicted oxidoreductase